VNMIARFIAEVMTNLEARNRTRRYCAPAERVRWFALLAVRLGRLCLIAPGGCAPRWCGR